ncbi:MAG: ribosomal-processing cysteine protease Prp [Acholeplasmataceae bacterium]|nr:ribosomal-processing cysteine protease Prp [Acholeplasmataceae bacterium]
MIKSNIVLENGKIKQFNVFGHANYAKKGEDIVCAAVSSAVLVTANAIRHLGLSQTIDLTVKDGDFKLTVLAEDDTVYKLLENLEYTIVDLEKQYPKYIKNQKEG